MNSPRTLFPWLLERCSLPPPPQNPPPLARVVFSLRVPSHVHIEPINRSELKLFSLSLSSLSNHQPLGGLTDRLPSPLDRTTRGHVCWGFPGSPKSTFKRVASLRVCMRVCYCIGVVLGVGYLRHTTEELQWGKVGIFEKLMGSGSAAYCSSSSVVSSAALGQACPGANSRHRFSP